MSGPNPTARPQERDPFDRDEQPQLTVDTYEGESRGYTISIVTFAALWVSLNLTVRVRSTSCDGSAVAGISVPYKRRSCCGPAIRERVVSPPGFDGGS